MIYEVREYSAVPGRLPDLIARFNQHTLRLFERHGMKVLFIGHTELGEDSANQLLYVLEFESYAAVEAGWAALFADPEWIEVRATTEANGPLVSSVRRRLINPARFAK